MTACPRCVAPVRARAIAAGLSIEFSEGDAGALPLERESCDLPVSMFGVTITPPPAKAVEFLRKCPGTSLRAFESLPATRQAALRRDLVGLQTRHKSAPTPGTNEVAAEHLEVIATRV